MSGTGFNLKTISRDPRESSMGQAILFVLPSIVITGISIVLFTLLTGFTMGEHNDFSIIIMSAIIFSLVGSAGMQVLVYRIVDDRDHFREGGALRAARLGTVYSLMLTVVVSAGLSIYFLEGLLLPVQYVLYFVALMALYSVTWILTAAFWASGEYRAPAVIFSAGYVSVFVLTYLAHLYNPGLTLAGYTAGIAVLLIVAAAVSARLFRYPLGIPGLWQDVAPAFKLVSQNQAAIMFNVLYILAIFLDKIIVWIHHGIESGAGIMVLGNYSAGGFLGLVPLFAIGGTAYFTSRTRLLIENRYKGTLSNIQWRAKEYKRLYWFNLRTMVLAAFVILLVVAALAYFLIGNEEIEKMLITTGIGSLFFLVIIFNSVVLPLFGRTGVSTLAVLAVCAAELAVIPLVGIDAWYASLGFLVGSLAGFLISFISTMRLFTDFEYHIFRYVASTT